MGNSLSLITGRSQPVILDQHRSIIGTMSKQLDDLAVFVAIARAGSVSGAARKLRVPKSSVSRALSRLEQSLRVQLVHRSTRQLNLSPAGTALLARAEPLVDALAAKIG